MTKEEWLSQICDKCPIDQVIKNCYNSSCDKDKCYNNFINEDLPFDDMDDRQESIKIIKEMLKDNGMD